MKVTNEQLKERQAWSLERKIEESWHRIEQWFNYWRDRGVYVSFSGGKDSTALLHLVRNNPFLKAQDIPAVFCDTGLEFPEIRDFVKTVDNVTWIKPKMPFTEVLKKYGFPVVSKEVSQMIHEVRTTKSEKLLQKRMHGDTNKYKSGKIPEKWKYLIDAPFKISHKCCDVMKKEPFKRYNKETGRIPYVGTMAEDSRLRQQSYLRSGCNSFEGKLQSTPMMFWTEKDVWEYIKTRNVPYSKIYDMGEDRTGCMFCAFGCHRDEVNRFQRMKTQHHSQWKFCMDVLGMREVLDYMGIEYDEPRQGCLFDWGED